MRNELIAEIPSGILGSVVNGRVDSSVRLVRGGGSRVIDLIVRSCRCRC